MLINNLAYCANIALKHAKGEYIIRLDADDYLDEAALLVMAKYLDANQDIALVYPNYYYVNEEGNFLGLERRKIIGKEVEVLDLPAHGACTMVRKRILKSIGGYSTEFKAQDGHEIWLNICNRYKVSNINTPLFYYRRHNLSITQDDSLLLDARKKIKRNIVKNKNFKSIAIIQAKNTYEDNPDICFEKIGKKPLIYYSIIECIKASTITDILVTTDDMEVIKYCNKNFPKIMTNFRPKKLSHYSTKYAEVTKAAIDFLEQEKSYHPDIISVINLHTPLRSFRDIDESVDTLILQDVDTVISVYEDYDLHFLHGSKGLEPLNKGALNEIRLEREALYVDNHAVKTLWRDTLENNSLIGNKIGHIVMPYERSINFANNFYKNIIKNKLFNVSQNKI